MTILEKQHYIWVYRSSHITLISFFYSLYQAQYGLAFIPGSIFITSLLYWKKPDYSYRRYLDMAVVKMSMVYQWSTAYSYRYGTYYYMINVVAMLCYLMGIYLYKKKQNWNSARSHMIAHLLANISHVVLVS